MLVFPAFYISNLLRSCGLTPKLRASIEIVIDSHVTKPLKIIPKVTVNQDFQQFSVGMVPAAGAGPV
jgi:hypothetical protein